MNIAQIEKNLTQLLDDFSQESFLYDLLLAYGLPKASITRLQKGNLDLSKEAGIVSWKKKVLFRVVEGEDLHLAISTLEKEARHQQRFVIVTDYAELLAIDTKTQDKLDIKLEELPRYFDFFLPWAGMEKAQYADENPADVKAAERMAKLFDEIKKDNPEASPAARHQLNVFLTRLLFCFFAEDTHIFADNQFTNALASHTRPDGSDLPDFLDQLFAVLNLPESGRGDYPAYLQAFPYVNGGLFREGLPTPQFTRRSRQAIIDSGSLDWQAINPDIFGSMFQAVIGAEQRGSLGQHYTSVPNIMKVIEPLFLNELREAFETALSFEKRTQKQKLKALQQRLGSLKIFDPACGSGNFLIIAYKELRKLEIELIQALAELSGTVGTGSLAFGSEYVSGIRLSQFYGIEIDDFAAEIAQLSLWLAEHQMNSAFFQAFGHTQPTLPLTEAGRITQGNACRLDWDTVCPKTPEEEVYVLGNPPYLGFQERKEQQKKDMDIVFSALGRVKRLDYIGCWFKKASDYISSHAHKFAFVSTNSICQGEQVSLIWPYILEKKKKEIFFAYQSFHWGNSAKNKAGVTVVVVGLRNRGILGEKIIFELGRQKAVNNISPYLIEGSNTVLFQAKQSLAGFPKAVLGSSGIDGGYLILSPQEREKFINDDPNSEKFIKKFIGGGDFLNGIERYCLWIPDKMADRAKAITSIKERIDACRDYRLNGGRDAQKAAEVPHRFFYRKHKDTNAIVFPMTSSSRREYLPAGYLSKDYIVSNGAFVVYDALPHTFSILISRMHMVWMSITSARMRNDFRYSVNLTYNTFPFPSISDQRKQEITQCVFRIIGEREQHPGKTLAQLYDPDKMPAGLREAHAANDEVIERCYRSRPFESDEERLAWLFKLYEQMIAEEAGKGGLFEKKGKKRKKK